MNFHLESILLSMRYLSCERIVLPSLKEAKFFPATTDLWSSRINHPFTGFTVYFVDNWSLRSFCLDIVAMFEDHTGQNITDAFQDILDNWKLDPCKLVATTTDKYVAAFIILDWLPLIWPYQRQ